jgi:hypothetical protein
MMAALPDDCVTRFFQAAVGAHPAAVAASNVKWLVDVSLRPVLNAAQRAFLALHHTSSVAPVSLQASLLRTATRVIACMHGRQHAFRGDGGWNSDTSCLTFFPSVEGHTVLRDALDLVLPAMSVALRTLRAGRPEACDRPTWQQFLLWTCRFYATVRTIRGGGRAQASGAAAVADTLCPDLKISPCTRLLVDSMAALAGAMHVLADEDLKVADPRSAAMGMFALAEVRCAISCTAVAAAALQLQLPWIAAAVDRSCGWGDIRGMSRGAASSYSSLDWHA